MNDLTLPSLAMTLFFIANPIGNSPVIMALVKNFSHSRQRTILIREGLMALLLALFFQFFGKIFLTALGIEDYAVSICGGVLLIIVALGMIFPSHQSPEARALKKEPFLVPIATPLLAGPSLLTVIMLFASKVPSVLLFSASIVLAWSGVLLVLVLIPTIQKLLGSRGVTALEQLMGMVVSFIAIEMTLEGIVLFMKASS